MSKNNISSIKEAFSYTTAVAGTTWDPTKGGKPFNISSGAGYTDDLLKGKTIENDLEQKAEKILPFPLDRIVDQLVVSYESLIKTRVTIMVSIKSPTMNQAEKNLLKEDLHHIDTCLKSIKKISCDIEKLKIGF